MPSSECDAGDADGAEGEDAPIEHDASGPASGDHSAVDEVEGAFDDDHEGEGAVEEDGQGDDAGELGVDGFLVHLVDEMV